MIIDDKVYLGDEDGDITVLQHGKELKVVSEQNMGSSVYSTVGAGQRRAVRHEPQSALRAGRGRAAETPSPVELSASYDRQSKDEGVEADMNRRDISDDRHRRRCGVAETRGLRRHRRRRRLTHGHNFVARRR